MMYNDLDVGVVVYHRERKGSGFPSHLTHSQIGRQLSSLLPGIIADQEELKDLVPISMHIKVLGRGKPAEEKKKKKGQRKKNCNEEESACAFLSGAYIFLFCEIESLFCQFSLVWFSSVQFSSV